VWNPHLLCEIKKIEKVQRRFTKRLLYRTNLSYDERLNLLGLERLELRRLFFDLYMAHNIIHNDVLDSKLFYQLPDFQRTRGDCKQHFRIPKPRTDLKKFNFASRSVKLWNNLPGEVNGSKNLAKFKNMIECIDFTEFLKGCV